LDRRGRKADRTFRSSRRATVSGCRESRCLCEGRIQDVAAASGMLVFWRASKAQFYQWNCREVSPPLTRVTGKVPIYLAVRVQTPSSPYSSSSARQWSAGGVSSSGPGPNSDVYKLTVGLEICSAERLTYQFGNPTGSLDLHRSSLT